MRPFGCSVLLRSAKFCSIWIVCKEWDPTIMLKFLWFCCWFIYNVLWWSAFRDRVDGKLVRGWKSTNYQTCVVYDNLYGRHCCTCCYCGTFWHMCWLRLAGSMSVWMSMSCQQGINFNLVRWFRVTWKISVQTRSKRGVMVSTFRNLSSYVPSNLHCRRGEYNI